MKFKFSQNLILTSHAYRQQNRKGFPTIKNRIDLGKEVTSETFKLKLENFKREVKFCKRS